MNKRFLIMLAIAGFMTISSCQKNEPYEIINDEVNNLSLTNPLNGEIVPGQYIVILNENITKFKSASEATYDERIKEVKSFAESMLKTKSASEFIVKQVYAQTLKGFSVNMSANNLKALKKDDRIKSIEPDRIISISPLGKKDKGEPPVQQNPYGITRVGYGNGIDKVAWIIDTGIDLDHPDLNVDVSRGATFITRGRDSKTPNDFNGHGTHCAGTVAAIDNEIGVIGVAAGATVVPVKVLNQKGSGYTSGVIAGIDYVASAASPGDAVNMSLGGGISETLDSAVINASNNGIFFSLAAGNESDNAYTHSPARANGPYIWTISAMDDNDYFAYFSNYGTPPVDFCEPGVSILSTYRNAGYAIMSGTSMAAPHMCGILLMTNGNPQTDGYVLDDPDGNPDPIGHI